MRTAFMTGPPGWRSGRRPRWRRRRRGTRGGCGRRGPGGPRSCGCCVLAQRSPGASLSGFMARHIEQPGSRQSKPAAREDVVRGPPPRPAPSRRGEPGTTRARADASRGGRRRTAAAARRSSMRLLVHEPMKTVSTAMSRIGVPAVRPMYASARAAASRPAGVGEGCRGRAPRRRSTRPGRGSCPTRRAARSVAASITTSLSNAAPSSVRSVRQSSSACSQSAPFGAWRRPSR